MKAKKTISPAKQKLLELSGKARHIQAVLKDKGAIMIPNVNSIVVEFYKKETQTDKFKKFKEWLNEGFKVIKGSKGFAVWSRPLKGKDSKEFKKKEGGTETLIKEFSFFGTAFLFNEKQVSKI